MLQSNENVTLIDSDVILFFSIGKTARERWKLFKNISKIGFQRFGDVADVKNRISHAAKQLLKHTSMCNTIYFAESNSLRWMQTKTQYIWFAASHVRGTISNRRMPHR